jgi:hypothetical protein
VALLGVTPAAAMADPLSFYVSTNASAGAGNSYAEAQHNLYPPLGILGPYGSNVQTGNCGGGCTVSAAAPTAAMFCCP